MTTTTTTTGQTPDVSSLVGAIESRDADAVAAWYHPDAILTIHDRDHPPTAPVVYRGSEIRSYYADICGRNVNHKVRDLIATPQGLAYVEDCEYPDGGAVVCVTVATLRDGKIDRQTASQTWDG